jgi:hypothetical protein
MKPGIGRSWPGISGAFMLTDVQIRKAKAADKPYKPTTLGPSCLRLPRRAASCGACGTSSTPGRNCSPYGPYPSVGLAEARDTAANAKRFLREGRDPAVEKWLRRLQVGTDRSSTFDAIAREQHDLNKGHWVQQHAFDVLHSPQQNVFPDLGSIPIEEITAANVVAVLRQIEDRPAVDCTAHPSADVCSLRLRPSHRPRRERSRCCCSEGDEAVEEGTTARRHGP